MKVPITKIPFVNLFILRVNKSTPSMKLIAIMLTIIGPAIVKLYFPIINIYVIIKALNRTIFL